jgi:hypothetical protein
MACARRVGDVQGVAIYTVGSRFMVHVSRRDRRALERTCDRLDDAVIATMMALRNGED